LATDLQKGASNPRARERFLGILDGINLKSVDSIRGSVTSTYWTYITESKQRTTLNVSVQN